MYYEINVPSLTHKSAQRQTLVAKKAPSIDYHASN